MLSPCVPYRGGDAKETVTVQFAFADAAADAIGHSNIGPWGRHLEAFNCVIAWAVWDGIWQGRCGSPMCGGAESPSDSSRDGVRGGASRGWWGALGAAGRHLPPCLACCMPALHLHTARVEFYTSHHRTPSATPTSSARTHPADPNQADMARITLCIALVAIALCLSQGAAAATKKKPWYCEKSFVLTVPVDQLQTVADVSFGIGRRERKSKGAPAAAAGWRR